MFVTEMVLPNFTTAVNVFKVMIAYQTLVVSPNALQEDVVHLRYVAKKLNADVEHLKFAIQMLRNVLELNVSQMRIVETMKCATAIMFVNVMLTLFLRKLEFATWIHVQIAPILMQYALLE